MCIRCLHAFGLRFGAQARVRIRDLDVGPRIRSILLDLLSFILSFKAPKP